MRKLMFSAALITVMASPALADDLARLIPNPALTPGLVASTDQAEVCGTVDGKTYSQRHRITPKSLKDAVAQAYGLPHADGKESEIDHRLPLALGGQDEAGNLWPQPWEGACGAHAKDKIEDRLWREVCKEGTTTLAAAQAILLGPYWEKLEGCAP